MPIQLGAFDVPATCTVCGYDPCRVENDGGRRDAESRRDQEAGRRYAPAQRHLQGHPNRLRSRHHVVCSTLTWLASRSRGRAALAHEPTVGWSSGLGRNGGIRVLRCRSR